MNDQQHGEALVGEAPQQPRDAHRGAEVELGGRLVGDQQRRLLREADRDLHALQLAAGERGQQRSANGSTPARVHRLVDGVVVGARSPAERAELRRAADCTASRTLIPVRHGGRCGTKARIRASLRPRSLRRSSPAPAHGAGARALDPGGGAHERRLAGAVGADDRDELAARELEPGAVDDRACRRSRPRSAADRQQPRSPRGHHTARRSSQRNSGTPRTTMNGPTGSTIGARARRARCRRRPAAPPPPSAEAGMTKACFEVPPAIRTTCGTTSPRKPSSPASAAAAAASSAAATPAPSRISRGPRAERRGDVVAEREPVERPDQHHRDDEAGREVGPELAQVGPAVRRQAAGEEEDHRLHAVGIGGQQARRAGAEQRRDRDAGEDHPADPARGCARPGDREHERRREQAERERPDRQQRDRAGEDEQDQRGAEAGAAGHADHVRRGERVGERSLQHRARDRQRGADRRSR